MQIDDIKNPMMKKLFDEVRHYSATIAPDAGDALEESNSNDELLHNWQSKLESLHEETQHFWGRIRIHTGGEIVMAATSPPFSPQAPHNPLKNLPGAIREYFKSRRIWQEAMGGRFALNDEFSLQVRRDTLRFRIEEKHRTGI